MKYSIPANSQPDIPDGKIYLLQPWPKYLSGKPHTGIDIYAQAYKNHFPQSTEPGKIIEIVPGTPKQVGRVVIEGEATGNHLYYKHVKTALKVGDCVKSGERLGIYDDSGKASGWWNGSHLHFEVHDLSGKNTDPVLYLIELIPDIVFMMSEHVKKRYVDRDYFNMMNLEAEPW